MMEKQNSYSHILKYTSLFGGVQVLGILVGLVRNKLVALIVGFIFLYHKACWRLYQPRTLHQCGAQYVGSLRLWRP